MTGPNPLRLMDVLEKYVTTVALADGFAVISAMGAASHAQVKDQTDTWAYVTTWVGFGTIFLLALAVNFWAFLRAERELKEWVGDSRARLAGMILILVSLFFATQAIGVHIYGLLRPILG